MVITFVGCPPSTDGPRSLITPKPGPPSCQAGPDVSLLTAGRPGGPTRSADGPTTSSFSPCPVVSSATAHSRRSAPTHADLPCWVSSAHCCTRLPHTLRPRVSGDGNHGTRQRSYNVLVGSK